MKWDSVGNVDSPLRKKRPAEKIEESPARQSRGSVDAAAVTMLQRKIRTMSAKLQKNVLDREVPYEMLPAKDLPLYHEAEAERWQDWTKHRIVRIIQLDEVEQMRRSIDSGRIIRVPFGYKTRIRPFRNHKCHYHSRSITHVRSGKPKAIGDLWCDQT